MTEVNIDRSAIKIGALVVLSVVGAWFFGYELIKLAGNPNLNQFLLTALSAILWLVFTALQIFLIKSSSIGVTAALLATLAVWLAFPVKFELLSLLSALLLFAALAAGFMRGRRELEDSMKISFSRISRRTVRAALTGLAIFLTLFLLQSFNFPKLEISKQAFEVLARGSDKLVAEFLPGFSFDSSVSEALKAVARSRLPQGTPEAAIAEAAEALRRELGKGIGAAIGANEKVLDALYNLTVSKLLGLPPAYKTITLIAIALAVFGLIKGLAFFLVWIVVALAFLLYQLLLALNFMRITFENKNKETIIVD